MQDKLFLKKRTRCVFVWLIHKAWKATLVCTRVKEARSWPRLAVIFVTRSFRPPPASSRLTPPLTFLRLTRNSRRLYPSPSGPRGNKRNNQPDLLHNELRGERRALSLSSDTTGISFLCFPPSL